MKTPKLRWVYSREQRTWTGYDDTYNSPIEAATIDRVSNKMPSYEVRVRGQRHGISPSIDVAKYRAERLYLQHRVDSMAAVLELTR